MIAVGINSPQGEIMGDRGGIGRGIGRGIGKLTGQINRLSSGSRGRDPAPPSPRASATTKQPDEQKKPSVTFANREKVKFIQRIDVQKPEGSKERRMSDPRIRSRASNKPQPPTPRSAEDPQAEHERQLREIENQMNALLRPDAEPDLSSQPGEQEIQPGERPRATATPEFEDGGQFPTDLDELEKLLVQSDLPQAPRSPPVRAVLVLQDIQQVRPYVPPTIGVRPETPRPSKTTTTTTDRPASISFAGGAGPLA